MTKLDNMYASIGGAVICDGASRFDYGGVEISDEKEYNMPTQDEEPPLLPLKVYLFNSQGFHTGAIVYETLAEYTSVGAQQMILDHIRTGREVRVTDPMDNCVFHAAEGRIIFPQINANETQTT